VVILNRRRNLWRAGALAIAVVFLLVPAATRAGQSLDPAGHAQQVSGFRNSSTTPPDPVLIVSDLSASAVVVAFLVLVPVARRVASADDRLPSIPPPAGIRPLRAPPLASLA